MKIWIVSEGEPLPIDGTDVRLRRMGQLSKKMVENGHEVHWFSSTYHHYKKVERYSKDTDLEYIDNFYFHLIKGVSYKRNVSIERIIHHKKISKSFLRISKNISKPDVIISTMAPLELSEAATKYGEANDVPVVVDIRDLWPEIYREVVPKWSIPFINPYITYNQWKLKKTLNKATNITAVTKGFLNYGISVAERNLHKNDKVFHTSYKVTNYANLKFSEEWASYNIKSEDFIVTFIGNFGKQFVIEPIFEAAKHLAKYKNIKFVLCGVGEDFNTFDAKKTNNIIMPGWIEGRQIRALLEQTNIGIAPYKKSDNFELNAPNKFGEYLSARLPILVSIDGVMNEFLNKYCAGEKYNSGLDLAQKIENLYLNPEITAKLSQGAYKLYEDHFNSDTVYTEFMNYLLSFENNISL